MTKKETVKRETTSIRVDPEIWREAKKLAIDLKLSIGEFLENLIKKELKKRNRL